MKGVLMSTELVLDHHGILAVTDGIVHYLTPCCKASVKGGQTGAVCRACYKEVPDNLGFAWMADDMSGWLEWGFAWLAAEPQENHRMIRELAKHAFNKANGK